MSKTLDQTKKIMSALVRMPPKPHEEMKLGKRTAQGPSKVAKPNKPKKPSK